MGQEIRTVYLVVSPLNTLGYKPLETLEVEIKMEEVNKAKKAAPDSKFFSTPGGICCFWGGWPPKINGPFAAFELPEQAATFVVAQPKAEKKEPNHQKISSAR